jgi:hypothetical protein
MDVGFAAAAALVTIPEVDGTLPWTVSHMDAMVTHDGHGRPATFDVIMLHFHPPFLHPQKCCQQNV